MQLEAVLQKIVNRRRERIAAEGPELSAKGASLSTLPGRGAAKPRLGPEQSAVPQQPGSGLEQPVSPQQPAGQEKGRSLRQEHAPDPLPFLPRGGLICEIKRRSPSRGAISTITDPAALARLYREKGASAISVLTEEDHFGGSLADLAAVRRAVPDIPLLRKDFLFSPEDIRTSRRWGADAVLLITRILDDAALKAFFQTAREEGLSVLAEAHSREDIRRLCPYRPALVGINSRDLESFTIDPLLPAALGPEIDWPALWIWESGIFSFEDARLARSCGFRGLLVGEGAVKNPETIPDLIKGLNRADGGADSDLKSYTEASEKEKRPFFWSALAKHRPLQRALHSATRRPLVKICGITRVEDALTAAREGADIIGFILAESPRKVDEECIRRCAGELDRLFSVEKGPLRVAVIVEKRGAAEEPQLQLAQKLLAQGVIDAVQLHGDARPGECADFAFPYYKALRPKNPKEAAELSKPPGEGGYHSPRLLIDAFSSRRAGGTGKQVDPEVMRGVQSNSGTPLWIAGGITPENVVKICREYSPELIDLSSGLESEPGIKDHQKIRTLFAHLEKGLGERGYFGRFGGAYVAEVLRPALDELASAFYAARDDAAFLEELQWLQDNYIGRPTPLLHAKNASRELGGADIYIKLEGLANTGAHKINNALGQALLAKRIGKRRIIAETGAGQHGLATAAACARLGLECVIYMGRTDYLRQHPNVLYMELFGARVIPVDSGTKTLKDAVNEALRDWAGSFTDTHYLIGSALGPAPFPEMVEYFQSVIGIETAWQLERLGVCPDTLVACVGGGSNAVGFFSPWLDTQGPGLKGVGCESPGECLGKDPGKSPRLLGAEAGGRGPEPGNHAARMDGSGKEGIFQGYKSRFLLDEDGQVYGTHSISAGLDYPGIGPRLADGGERGRIDFTRVTDQEALEALRFFARTEGLLFALESAHAGFAGIKEAKRLGPGKAVIINMSGRGDKDLFITAPLQDPVSWKAFLDTEAALIGDNIRDNIRDDTPVRGGAREEGVKDEE
jgi:tryptophan synthase beta chain